MIISRYSSLGKPQSPIADAGSAQARGKLLKAALWYAARGYRVFPLHPGQKTPATRRGVHDATTDAGQIRAWWAENPNYNIGIAAGASGLLILDPDTYKTGITAADLVEPDHLATVTTLTPNGGQHIWYRQPDGAALGNSTGDLPAGVDVRGHGGYVVAPPSVFVDPDDPQRRERVYRFAPGRKPTDLHPLPLPDYLYKRLAAAQRKAEAVIFGPDIAHPDLAQWRLSDAITGLIHNPPPKGERSEGDYRVMLALVDAGASDDEIRAVFRGYPIGYAGKYAGRGRNGDHYLAHSIGKARAHQREGVDLVGKLRAARATMRSAAGIEYQRDQGIKRPANYEKTMDGVLEHALGNRTLRPLVNIRTLGEITGASHETARNHLYRLEDAGLWTVTRERHGLRVDLTPLFELCRTLTYYKQGACVNNVKVLQSCEDGDFYADHRAGDVWRTGIYAHAQKRRRELGEHGPLAQSLGANALLIWPYLEAARVALTAYELASLSGFSVDTVRRTLTRLDNAGLVVIWQGRPYRYELHPNAPERLEERTPHMVTAGMGAIIARRNANARAKWAQWEIKLRVPREPGELARLEQRRARADALAAAWDETLEGMGINPHAKVKLPKVRTLTYDPLSEWELHAPAWEAWAELDPVPPLERYRLLEFAGYARGEVDEAIRQAGRAGKEKRVFARLEHGVFCISPVKYISENLALNFI